MVHHRDPGILRLQVREDLPQGAAVFLQLSRHGGQTLRKGRYGISVHKKASLCQAISTKVELVGADPPMTCLCRAACPHAALGTMHAQAAGHMGPALQPYIFCRAEPVYPAAFLWRSSGVRPPETGRTSDSPSRPRPIGWGGRRTAGAARSAAAAPRHPGRRCGAWP